MYNYTTNKKIYEKFNENNIENIVSYKPQVKDYMLLECYQTEDYIGYTIKSTISCIKCRQCCKKISRFKGYRISYPSQDIINNKLVIFKCIKKMFYCNDCNKYFVQSTPNVKFRKRISDNIVNLAIYNLKLKFTYSDVARLLKISISSVINIFDQINIKYKRYSNIKHLLIDELKLISTTNKFQFVAIDADSNQIVDILENRDQATVYKYLIDNFSVGDLETITMDMGQPYKSAVNSFNNVANKEVKIIIDKFHFVRQLMWDLDDIRISEYENPKLSIADSNMVKKAHKILRTRYNKLSSHGKDRLQKAFDISNKLYIAHQFKEQYLRLVSESASSSEFIKEFKEWFYIITTGQIKGFDRTFTSLY